MRMRVYNLAHIGALSLAACLSTAATAPAAIIINEFAYDDTGTADDREFVELYNNGAAAVDVSGWVVTGRDPTTVNAAATIPAATSIAPGGFYVIGNVGVPNLNQTVAGGFLENDNESIELRDVGGALQDALIYEANKGMAGNLAGSGLPGEVGAGIFSNSQNIDISAVAPLTSSVSQGRFVDGRDTNNNGRDFGLRPSTPGATNAPAGFMTFYNAPNPVGQTVGTDVAGLTGSFVNARYIDPTVADANNPNAIAAPAPTGNRAIVAWDSSGGGNSVTSNQTFNTTQGGFKISAYLETSDIPQNTDAAGANVAGSELTIYGIGSGDALTNLTDLAGNVGIAPVVLPVAESANGTTGVAWVYERTAINGATGATQMLYLVDANDGGDSDLGGNTPLDWTILQTIDISGLTSDWFQLGISIDALGNGVASFNGATLPTQMLYLVDANDGGDSDLGGNTPLDWTILQTIDISGLTSDWFQLGISIDALGNGVASFNGANFAFVTSTNLHSGAFNVGYRENVRLGADTTPDSIMRPATFTVPEPASVALAALSACGLIVASRRRRTIA